MAIKKTLNLDDSFLSKFNEEKFERVDLGINRKNLKFGLIKLKSNKFDNESLYEFLKNASVFYSLPRNRINEIISQGKFVTLVEESKMKFRDSNSNEGEGGELILYSLLEDDLNAPKLLSKMKLKTNSNMYVNGADGIHLNTISKNNYEIIYNESKMYQDFSIAIDKAIESTRNLIDSPDLLNFENTVLTTNLHDEFDDETVSFIINSILPSKSGFNSHPAFSIFIGFEIKEGIIDKTLDYDDYLKKIKEYVKKRIGYHRQKFIKFSSDYPGYSFYFYIIPFENIDKVRRKIIEEIEGRVFIK